MRKLVKEDWARLTGFACRYLEQRWRIRVTVDDDGYVRGDRVRDGRTEGVKVAVCFVGKGNRMLIRQVGVAVADKRDGVTHLLYLSEAVLDYGHGAVWIATREWFLLNLNAVVMEEYELGNRNMEGLMRDLGFERATWEQKLDPVRRAKGGHYLEFARPKGGWLERS